ASFVIFLSVILLLASVHAEPLIIDNFNQGGPPNALGTGYFDFADLKSGSSLEVKYVSGKDAYTEVGYSLELNYKINRLGFAGCGTILKGYNISNQMYLSFMVRGGEGWEIFEIGIKDEKGNEKKVLSNDHFVTTREWQMVKIPLSAFADIDLTIPENLNLAFTKVGSGKIVIDNLAIIGRDERVDIIETTEDKIEYKLLDDMENRLKWRLEGAEGTTKSLEKVDTAKGKALEFTYSLEKGDWAQITRDMKGDWSGLEKLRITYKAEGSKNNIEIKLVDADGSNFGVKFSPGTPTDGWITKTIPIKYFQHWWAGDKLLDLTKLKMMNIAVSKIDGGKGKIAFDDIEYFRRETPEEIKPQEKKEFKILDDMSQRSRWRLIGAEGTSRNIRKTTGVVGDAIEFDYSLEVGDWVQIEKDLTDDFSSLDEIKIRYKGVGSKNNIEIKLVDADGSNFGVKYEEATATDDWVIEKIPFNEFQYWWGGDNKLDLTQLKLFCIAISKKDGGSGKVVFDDIEYSEKPKVTLTERPLGTNKVLIDGFERVNPNTIYRVFEGDLSDLDLRSDRDVQEGDYSMIMDYTLTTERGSATWVTASATPQKPLDWSRVEKIRIWIKGDGTRNSFQFSSIDADGEIWGKTFEYALINKEWRMFEIELDKLNLLQESTKINNIFNKEKIKRLDLTIIGETNEATSGIVWIDKFYAVGKGLVPEEVSLPEVARFLQIPIGFGKRGNIDFSGVAWAMYQYTPEMNHEVCDYAKLIADGKIDNFNSRVEIVSTTEYYDRTVYADTHNKIYTSIPDIDMIAYKMQANNLLPYVSQITLGNLWIDYGIHIFPAKWEWKGLNIEGNIEGTSYDWFIIKHRYDSFTTGLQFERNFPWNLFFRTTAVYYHDTAKSLANAQIVNGVLTIPDNTNIITELVGRDAVILFETYKRFFSDKLTLELIYGYNYLAKYGQKNISNLTDPTFTEKLQTPIKENDDYINFEIKLKNVLFDNSFLRTKYRKLGTNFKPRWRDDPMSYDEWQTDQKGFNLFYSKSIGPFGLWMEYDDIDRISDDDGFRRFAKGNIGYYGIPKIAVSLYYEYYKEKYTFNRGNRSNFETNKYEEKNIYELYFEDKITNSIRLWTKYRIERPTNLNLTTNNRYQTNIFQSKIEYYLTNYARLFLEYKRTRYGDPSWEPFGDDYSDNFGKITFEFNY
ncbi:MAG: CIA30 family protein, partial [Candidatus Hydrogenedentota bacterium]